MKPFKLEAVMLLFKFDLSTLTFCDHRCSLFEHVADGGVEYLCGAP
jgi:hypothetical protein